MAKRATNPCHCHCNLSITGDGLAIEAQWCKIAAP